MADNTTTTDANLTNSEKGLLALGVTGFVLLVLGVIAIWYIWRRLTHRIVLLECRLREIHVSRPNSVNSVSVFVDPWPSTSPSQLPITKTSVKLWGRQATIVGNANNLSQVYSASQDYFAKDGQLWKAANFSVPSNRLTIKSTFFNTELPDGQLSAEPTSSSSQRPTSYIQLISGLSNIEEEAAQSAPVPFLGQKEIFKHKTLGKAGGKIEVSGILLEVPSGALDKEIEISVGVTWDTAKYPKLTHKEALLSPVVICEPQGIVFTKPVKLSFPHCVRNSLKDWVPKFMYSQQRIDAPPSWKPMQVGDYTQRHFGDKIVSIEVNHFTLYTLAGEPRKGKRVSKDIKILAFAPPIKQGELHKVRIYCVENYEKEMPALKHEEKVDLGGRLVLPKKSIIFHDNGENLFVENHNLSEGWRLLGDKIAELDFEQIWHGLTPNHEFAFDATPTVSLFEGEFRAYQSGEEGKFQVLNITDKAEKIETDPYKLSTGFIPAKLRQRLVVLLKPETVSGNDWKMVAELLGDGQSEIEYLETWTSPSPVDAVLNKWESQSQKLEDLLQMMLAIHREDAAMEIKKYIPGSEGAANYIEETSFSYKHEMHDVKWSIQRH